MGVGLGCRGLARCWGSEGSDPLGRPPWLGVVGGFVCLVPGLAGLSLDGGGCGWWRGLLFEICIVDASIFVAKCCVMFLCGKL